MVSTERVGPGGYSKKFYTRGGSAQRSNPLTFYIPYLREMVPLSYTFHGKWYPFHKPSIEIMKMVLLSHTYSRNTAFLFYTLGMNLINNIYPQKEVEGSCLTIPVNLLLVLLFFPATGRIPVSLSSSISDSTLALLLGASSPEYSRRHTCISGVCSSEDRALPENEINC